MYLRHLELRRPKIDAKLALDARTPRGQVLDPRRNADRTSASIRRLNKHRVGSSILSSDVTKKPKYLTQSQQVCLQVWAMNDARIHCWTQETSRRFKIHLLWRDLLLCVKTTKL